MCTLLRTSARLARKGEQSRAFLVCWTFHRLQVSPGESRHVSRELKIPQGSDPPGLRLAFFSGFGTRELVGVLQQVFLVLPAPLPECRPPPRACQPSVGSWKEIEVFSSSRP